jgi:erythronate-4-phosphate dehydrogenase
MKIIADLDIPYIEDAFKEFGDVITVPGHEISNDLIKDASILIIKENTLVNEELLKDTVIKFIGSATVNTDHVDIDYLSNNFIGFASAPGSNAESVAEYVISAVIALTNANKKPFNEYTMGIIGVGNVGSRVLEKCTTLGIRCIINDPPKEKITQSYFYLPLDEVLEKSDIITLHVPFTEEEPDQTYNLVNSEFLKKMKDGALFINTSSAKVINEEEFLRVAPDKLNGIALDVWETEPEINLELLKIANIATPHIAGSSYISTVIGTGMVHSAACAFFFKEPEWDLDRIIEQLKCKTIQISNTQDPVSEIISKAYPILEDDKILRDIINIEKSEQRKFFDNLRNTYSRRDSFSLCKIKSDDLTLSTVEWLAKLGFRIW